MFTSFFALMFTMNFCLAFAQCGPVLQTFWKIDFKKREISRLSVFHHSNHVFCPPESGPEFNGVAELLNEKMKTEVSQPIRITRELHLETFKDGTISSERKLLDAQEIQIKFVDNEFSKRSRFIRIRFSDGTVIGPGKFSDQ